MKKIFIQINCVLTLLLVTIPVFSQNVITVTDCNLNGWVKQPTGNSTLSFVNGPEDPPLAKGSLKFFVPPGIAWPGDFVRLRNGQYSGMSLSSLTELSYETYIEERDTITDIQFIVILSDINDDGIAEHNLVFDPRYQNPTFIRGTMPNQGHSMEHVWQKWDALNGGWFYGGEAITDPDHNGPFFTMAEYLSLYPNAEIKNDPAKGGPAIRLTAGGVVFKPNFYASLDDFRIGFNGVTTIYDFEFTIANAGADKTVTYGYGSNCIALNGAAAGGISPYAYVWSPGGERPNHISTTVCPAATTTYTLTVTDKNGCSRIDDVTVFVNDVRCGNKMDKVRICHSNKEICVATESVPAHLQHGDGLGSCGEALSQSGMNIPVQNEIKEKMGLKLYNYPNPFTNNTRIIYEIPYDGNVSLKLYDPVGREIAVLVTADKKEGQYSFDFNRHKLPAGVYYYKLTLFTLGTYVSKTGVFFVDRH